MGGAQRGKNKVYKTMSGKDLGPRKGSSLATKVGFRVPVEPMHLIGEASRLPGKLLGDQVSLLGSSK